jgi:hypothetical protein
VVGDCAVEQHGGGEAERLDVDIASDLAACDRLADEHGGEAADLIAPASQQLPQPRIEIDLRPAMPDDRSPVLVGEAADEALYGSQQAIRGVVDLRQARRQLVEVGLRRDLTDREVELLLARKVSVDEPHGDAGLGGDGRHAGSAVAAGQHRVVAPVDDALANLAGVLDARPRHRASCG